MATRDAFAGKFNRLLKEIPKSYTLAQWQFLYQQAILSMGTRILERFQHDIIGRDPFDTRAPPPPPPPPPVFPDPGGGQDGVGSPYTGTGGQPPGPHPSVTIACVVLGVPAPPGGPGP